VTSLIVADSHAAFEEEIVPLSTADGRPANLVHLIGERAPSRGPVLLVHGAGVRANIFRAPVRKNIVEALAEEGYDVWLENWRASIDFPANEWTLDQAALHDHPLAVRTVAQRSGSDDVKAVIHCQGSTSFMMSVVAGLTPEISTVVSNAVSLHPNIPWFSNLKIQRAAPIIKRLTPYLDPHWGREAPSALAKVLVALVRLVHHECKNTVCKMVSFTYGSGFPALWRHENLNTETHDWLTEEFGKVPLTFFHQMAECVNRGRLVSVEGYSELPADFTAQEPQTDARFAFFAGRRNQCFSYESQVRTFEFFDDYAKNRHSLHVLPEYSHLDVFMGKNADRDVFPRMLEELGKETR
jgi:hypothetical protein